RQSPQGLGGRPRLQAFQDHHRDARHLLELPAAIATGACVAEILCRNYRNGIRKQMLAANRPLIGPHGGSNLIVSAMMVVAPARAASLVGVAGPPARMPGGRPPAPAACSRAIHADARCCNADDSLPR